MIQELDTVILTHDMPDHGLKQGDMGAIVHCYPDGAAFEVEFMTKEGHTTAVLTLTDEDIRPMNQTEKTIHILDVQMNELDDIVSTASERLSRWKIHTAKLISEHVGPNEARKLDYIEPSSNVANEANTYRALVQALKEDIQPCTS